MLGKVYGPDDAVPKKLTPFSDLPGRFPQPTSPNRLDEMSKDIESMKRDLKNIKRALKDHGIALE